MISAVEAKELAQYKELFDEQLKKYVIRAVDKIEEFVEEACIEGRCSVQAVIHQSLFPRHIKGETLTNVLLLVVDNLRGNDYDVTFDRIDETINFTISWLGATVSDDDYIF